MRSCVHRSLTTAAAAAVVCGMALLFVPAATAADDAAAEAAAALAKRHTELKKSVKTHRKEKDLGALGGDLKAGVDLHADAAGKKHKALRKKVLGIMASIPKAMGSAKLNGDFLTAMGQTRDPNAAMFVRPYLKQANAKKADETLRTAIRVAGEVPSGCLVPGLLKILDKSKHMGAAAMALNSLASYGKVKSHRAKIFAAVVESVRKSRPGAKGMYGVSYGALRSGEATRSRWAALSPILPKMLAKLTGIVINGVSVDDWFTMYDDNKRDLGDMFDDQD